MIESIIIIFITIFVLVSRNSKNENVYKYFSDTVKKIYNKYAPYSFQVAREKAKELGQEFTTRQYIIQVVIFGGAGAVVAYLYFRSITWAIIYAVAAIAFIPYLAVLRCKRIYSEYIFEQIQVYTTNFIMEFNYIIILSIFHFSSIYIFTLICNCCYKRCNWLCINIW